MPPRPTDVCEECDHYDHEAKACRDCGTILCPVHFGTHDPDHNLCDVCFDEEQFDADDDEFLDD